MAGTMVGTTAGVGIDTAGAITGVTYTAGDNRDLKQIESSVLAANDDGALVLRTSKRLSATNADPGAHVTMAVDGRSCCGHCAVGPHASCAVNAGRTRDGIRLRNSGSEQAENQHTKRQSFH